MGKNSNYKVKRPRDYWPTVDPDCMVEPFVAAVRGKTYAEPCYGAGDLEDRLMDAATCKWRSDLEPQVPSATQHNALYLTKDNLSGCDLIITNPPYHWSMLEPLLKHLPTLKPTWLLLPADFMHNKRSGPYMRNCAKVIAIGRMFWINGKDDTHPWKGTKGKDNYCWYRFHDHWGEPTVFIGR
jgi:hypothetical protein